MPHPEDIRELVSHATGEGAPPADPTLINNYRKLVGALLYAATSTRPDIAYAISMLCRAMSKPTDQLMAAALLRVLAYLSRQHIETSGCDIRNVRKRWRYSRMQIGR